MWIRKGRRGGGQRGRGGRGAYSGGVCRPAAHNMHICEVSGLGVVLEVRSPNHSNLAAHVQLLAQVGAPLQPRHTRTPLPQVQEASLRLPHALPFAGCCLTTSQLAPPHPHPHSGDAQGKCGGPGEWVCGYGEGGGEWQKEGLSEWLCATQNEAKELHR